jgi:outer membrane biogenesis lipoprotein LolB
MKKAVSIAFFGLLIFFSGCKSSKRVATNGELNSRLSSKQLIKEHTKNDANFNTLQSRVKVEYVQGDYSQSHSISLRMERDKAIWLNATLGVVRVMITPEKVSYYNKLDRTYFDGDYSLISDLLGTHLDFENVQQLLLGQSIYDMSDEKYASGTFEKSYLLQPKNQSSLFEIFFLLNPTHFKLDSQQFAQPLDNRILQIDYEDYQEVESQILPQNIRVIAVEAKDETIIDMELKSVTLNENLRFPFKIPSGFDEIVIK